MIYAYKSWRDLVGAHAPVSCHVVWRHEECWERLMISSVSSTLRCLLPQPLGPIPTTCRGRLAISLHICMQCWQCQRSLDISCMCIWRSQRQVLWVVDSDCLLKLQEWEMCLTAPGWHHLVSDMLFWNNEFNPILKPYLYICLQALQNISAGKISLASPMFLMLSCTKRQPVLKWRRAFWQVHLQISVRGIESRDTKRSLAGELEATRSISTALFVLSYLQTAHQNWRMTIYIYIFFTSSGSPMRNAISPLTQ